MPNKIIDERGTIGVFGVKKAGRYNKYYKWSTNDEMNFIRKLASYPDLSYLENYLEAARRRHDWGGIDKDKIIEFVEKLLGGER